MRYTNTLSTLCQCKRILFEDVRASTDGVHLTCPLIDHLFARNNSEYDTTTTRLRYDYDDTRLRQHYDKATTKN